MKFFDIKIITNGTEFRVRKLGWLGWKYLASGADEFLYHSKYHIWLLCTFGTLEAAQQALAKAQWKQYKEST